MKRSSVFVLAPFLFFISCRSEWKHEDFTGSYFSIEKPKPLMERWFNSENVTGWDYNDDDFTLYLNADSTFLLDWDDDEIARIGSAGNWTINGDTLFLNWWLRMGSSNGLQKPVEWHKEILLIEDQNELVVFQMDPLEPGDLLISRNNWR